MQKTKINILKYSQYTKKTQINFKNQFLQKNYFKLNIIKYSFHNQNQSRNNQINNLQYKQLKLLNYQSKRQFFDFFNTESKQEKLLTKKYREYDEKVNGYVSPEELIQLMEEIVKLQIQIHGTEKYENYQRDQLTIIAHLLEMQDEQQAERRLEEILNNPQEKTDDDIYTQVDAIMIQTTTPKYQNQPQKNIELLQRAQKLLNLTEEGNKTDHMAVSYSQLSENFYRIGEIQQAAENLQLACKTYDHILETAQSKKESPENIAQILIRQAMALEQLGNFHSDLRNQEEAIQCLEIAIQNWQTVNEQSQQDEISPYYVRVLNSLGQTYCTFGEYDKGFPLQLQSKKLLEPVKPHLIDNYVWIVLGIARTYHKLLDYKKSQEFTDIAEKSAKEHKAHPQTMIQIWEHKINLYLTNGEHEQGFQECNLAIAFMEKNNMQMEPLYSRIQFSKGLALILQEKYKEALIPGQVAYDHAVQIFGEDDEQVGDSLRVLGLSHLYTGLEQKDNKLINKGFDQMKKALSIYEQTDVRIQDAEVVLQELIGFTSTQQNYKQAIIYTENLRRIRTKVLKQLYYTPEQIQENLDALQKGIDELYTLLDQQQKNIKQ